ncbi:MAG: 1-deoxy-D-xylulose-5-phosphate synthase [Bacteroidetes bacterium GWF2_38_335]|nr:MAG: 1-deoxy-D-xylulose-5-phosphate synthase [Bacteroidetes bacterium GWF2_38_335]OFY78375.1 MAG: 1-deoxy-D-xylulose-5-phosphate synthase [Bacteroidetes bacterium RIFOXYA12_FULL_38_20]HBS87467.1 1-deoxy-D-xylulose-5-phosphate synthase [Bacteroidales bacterium]
MAEKPSRLLDNINDPKDLRKLEIKELVQLSEELRNFIIDEVSCNPGHFGASLGTVELSVALHYSLNTPYDKLIWDVGHQAYGHKILTGRKDVFHTNRKYKGISGFPKVSESEYDSFGVGHASTSISAALGMAIAAKQKNEKRRVVAVIGDGSMTGGLAFEGLNNAGIKKDVDLLVILNDNNMAIDASVGALKDYLLDIATSKTYNRVKDDVWRFLGKVSQFGPNAQKMVQKIDNSIKSIILRHSNLFESLNFRYFGPVDGHDVHLLARIIKDLGEIPGPKLLHVKTIKGKGFKLAEDDQTYWHSPGVFNKETGEILSTDNGDPKPPRYQDVFGESIVELAEKNEKILGITPAMPTGCSLNIMMEKMPNRAFDVGIAEAHAVTFSAGLAIEGFIPFCNIYSTFMQRAYDQIIHDVALQNLNVVFCMDRGGLVGADGATHHGAFDLAFMRSIPNMIVSAPMNEVELRNLMYTAQLGKGPFSIRYPRGNGVLADWKKPFEEIAVGTGRIICEGEDVAVLSIGHPGNYVSAAIAKLKQEGIYPAHYDMRFVKPLDGELLHKIFKKFKNIVTVEDGVLQGGFGSAVIEFMADNNYSANIRRLGIPDKFIEHGTQFELRKDCGFDIASITEAVKQLVSEKFLDKMKSVIK